MSTNDGGPAFPLYIPGSKADHGMSLRDYFAAQALAGAKASRYLCGTDNSLAIRCYEMADAMLAERERKS